VLDNSDLENRSRNGEQDQSGAHRVRRGRRTLPKAPLPTLRRRTKWNKFTSPSKSMGCRDVQLMSGRSDSRRDRPTSGRQQTPPMAVWNYNKASSRIFEAKGRRIAAQLPRAARGDKAPPGSCSAPLKVCNRHACDRRREFSQLEYNRP
jgi:hypothetical protein